MRIALFTETYTPYINGVITHVKILKEGLEQLGHKVLVVTADPKASHHYLEGNVLHCPGISFKKIYDYGIAPPVKGKRLKILRDFKPDIIHIHTEFGVGYSGVSIAKQLNVPLIYTLHTMYDEYLYYIAPKPFIGLTKRVAHKYMGHIASRATEITGPSKKVEEYFHECGIYKKVHVINNPVELGMFDPSNIDEKKKVLFRKKYNIAKDELVVCFCGRLGMEKSVDVLLKFWAETVKPNDKMKLLIIGEGPAKKELEVLAAKLHIGDMVIFTGKVMHDEMPPYYAGCDLYATTSLSDTNSISMLEAMATGLPTLHIHDELNKGQVVHGVNGYIFRNAQEMYKQLKDFQKKSPEEIQEMRTKVSASVQASGATDIGKKLLKVYGTALRKFELKRQMRLNTYKK